MALALLVFQSAAGTLNLADSARVYARRMELRDSALLDLENTPRLELGLSWPTTQLDLEYAPRFLWVDVLGSDPSPTLLLHNAGLVLTWQWPRVTATFSQTAAIGDQDFTRVGVTSLTVAPGTVPTTGVDGTAPPTGLDPVPGAVVVSVADEQTSAGVRYDWSRRWSSELEAAFGVSGGADEAAQQFLPRQRTALLGTSLDFRRSRRDELSSALTFEQIHTSNGYDHWLASFAESWSTRWTRNTGGEIGAGAAFQDTSGPFGFTSSKWVPIATAGAWYTTVVRAAQARLQWDFGYSPDVDVLSGVLQNRMFTTASAGVTFDHTSVRLALGASQSFPRDAPNAIQVLSADLAFQRELLTWLDLLLGGQIFRQELISDSALAPDGTRWLLYAGLQGRVPEARF